MLITHVTYARVADDAVVRPMSLRPHDPGVDAFLLDHLRELRQHAAGGASPLAVFTSDQARDTFTALRDGGDGAFLAAAGQLTAQLIGAMDGRSATGLLVCIRAEEGGVVSAAALKLEVVTEHAARLDEVDRGELSLSAVTNVVDAPGQLQKGALIPDSRPGSDVIVGDRLTQDAAYFPRAFGIRTEQRDAETASQLVDVVRRHDQTAARQLATVLPTVTAGPTAEVLSSAAAVIPELTQDLIRTVTTELAEQPRPVHRVDTHAQVQAVYEADGVKVTVPSAAIDRVQVERDPEQGWRIVVRTSVEPQVSYKR